MGGMASTQTKDPELEVMIGQCEEDLQKLDLAARAIKETIDIQHEVIQNVLDNRQTNSQQEDFKRNSTDERHFDEKEKSKGQGAEPVLEDMKNHELHAMASMQNIFCLNAFIIQNATGRFSDLLKEFRKRFKLDSSVDSHRPKIKKIKSNHMSKTEKIESEHMREELIQDKDREIKTKEARIAKMEKDLEDKNSKMKKMESELKSKESAIDRFEREVRRLKKERTELEENDRHLTAKLRELSKPPGHEISGRYQPRYVPKPKVLAVLYTPRKGDMLNMVAREITEMLTNQFVTINMDLQVTECESATALPPNVPIIVMCINASRLGTDVSNAVHGLTLTQQIAVVILHHKEMHALPNQASERVLTSSDYKALGGMYDMAFLSQKGVYPCDMNNVAVSGLVEFIKQRNNQSQQH